MENCDLLETENKQRRSHDAFSLLLDYFPNHWCGKGKPKQSLVALLSKEHKDMGSLGLRNMEFMGQSSSQEGKVSRYLHVLFWSLLLNTSLAAHVYGETLGSQQEQLLQIHELNLFQSWHWTEDVYLN